MRFAMLGVQLKAHGGKPFSTLPCVAQYCIDAIVTAPSPRNREKIHLRFADLPRSVWID